VGVWQLSEIRATTISDAAGTGPVTLTGQYAAKAWVNFNGESTVSIRGSGNVSSLTDHGTGDYTVNFANALSSANYSTTHAGGKKASTWGLYIGASSYGSTTTGHRFFNTMPSDVAGDTSYISLTFTE
jgi:hypothetical protein